VQVGRLAAVEGCLLSFLSTQSCRQASSGASSAKTVHASNPAGPIRRGRLAQKMRDQNGGHGIDRVDWIPLFQLFGESGSEWSMPSKSRTCRGKRPMSAIASGCIDRNGEIRKPD